MFTGAGRTAGFPTDLYCQFTVIDRVEVNKSTDVWETFHPFRGAAGTDTGWGRGAIEELTDLETPVADPGSQ